MRIVLPALVAVTLLSPVAAAAQATRQVPVDALIYDLRNPDPVRRRKLARVARHDHARTVSGLAMPPLACPTATS